MFDLMIIVVNFGHAHAVVLKLIKKLVLTRV
jgi:hypothetical protein